MSTETAHMPKSQIEAAAKKLLSDDELMRDRAVINQIVEATHDRPELDPIKKATMQRFLELRLGTNEERSQHGQLLTRKLLAEINASPRLQERYLHNIDEANRIVRTLAPVHATNPGVARKLSEKDKFLTAFDVAQQGEGTTSSFHYDTLMGLDMANFFTAGFPDSTYGLYFAVADPSLFESENCAVSFHDFSSQLDSPHTQEGKDARERYGTLKISKTEERNRENKDLFQAFEAEADAYKQSLISGEQYLDLLAIVLAVSDESISFDSLLSLPTDVLADIPISLENADPKQLLAFMLRAEVKVIQPESSLKIDKLVVPEGGVLPADGKTVFEYSYDFSDSQPSARAKFAKALYGSLTHDQPSIKSEKSTEENSNPQKYVKTAAGEIRELIVSFGKLSASQKVKQFSQRRLEIRSLVREAARQLRQIGSPEERTALSQDIREKIGLLFTAKTGFPLFDGSDISNMMKQFG